jgi:hypothetical protein
MVAALPNPSRFIMPHDVPRLGERIGVAKCWV